MIEKFKFSGLWRRLCAYVIDICFLSILFSTLLVFSISKFYLAVMLIFSFNFTLFGWLYFASLESSPLQATLGKWLLGMKVVDKRGARLTFKRATLRFFGKWVSALFLWLGFLMIAFSRRKQALHDKLVSTYVIIRH